MNNVILLTSSAPRVYDKFLDLAKNIAEQRGGTLVKCSIATDVISKAVNQLKSISLVNETTCRPCVFIVASPVPGMLAAVFKRIGYATMPV